MHVLGSTYASLLYLACLLQVVIVLELLPVSLGVFCALSWLPGSMTCQTPRLAVKSLTPVAEPVVSQKRSKQKMEQT